MTRYYKGNLFLVNKSKMINKINGYKVNGNIVDYKNNQFYRLCSNLPKEKQTHIARIITNNYQENTITEPYDIKILNQIFKDLPFNNGKNTKHKIPYLQTIIIDVIIDM